MRTRHELIALIAVVLAHLVACAPGHLPVDESPIYDLDELSIETHTYSSYTPRGFLGLGSPGAPVELELDVYAPPPAGTRLRPAVVFLHGGAFVVGSRRGPATVHLAQQLAIRGFVVASIDYRLNAVRDLSLVKAGYAATQDARAAVRWVRANAEQLGVDADYIALGGNSAGAIAALHGACLRPDEPILDRLEMLDDIYGALDACGEFPRTSSRVYAAISLGGGVLDTNIVDPGDVPAIIYAHGLEDDWCPYFTGIPSVLSLPIPKAMQLPDLYGPGVWGKRDYPASPIIYGLDLDETTHELLISDAGTTQRSADRVVHHIARSLIAAAQQ